MIKITKTHIEVTRKIKKNHIVQIKFETAETCRISMVDGAFFIIDAVWQDFENIPNFLWVTTDSGRTRLINSSQIDSTDPYGSGSCINFRDGNSLLIREKITITIKVEK